MNTNCRPAMSLACALACLAATAASAATEPPAAPAIAPTYAPDDPASWAFLPAHDAFSGEALFDLRSLNEHTAGEHGFVRVSPDGDFTFGDGTPVRFWAVNFEPRVEMDHATLAYAARFLAKRGVNMVRWHGFLNPKVPGSDAFFQPSVRPDEPLKTPVPPLEELDRDQRDKCWRLVAAMRSAGIYVTLSPYWAVNFRQADRWGLPAGFRNERDAQGLLFFDPRMQAAYKRWLHDWLVLPNPYTGIPLAADPAVAIIQFQNEDSLLFWTVDFMSDAARHELATLFGHWLVKHYGSLDTARTAWGPGAAESADDWAAGVPTLLKLDYYQQDPPPARAQRLADQLEFLTETMRDTNVEIARYLREDLGVHAVLNAGNWRTANNSRMIDAERWSYLPAEALAINRYYTSPHLGRDSGWAVDPGHRFASFSALRHPQEIPTSLRQVAGRPMLIPESTWVMPSRYRAEAPLTVAAYQSLNGVDAYYWFAMNYADWTQPTIIGGRYRGAFKWTSQTPDVLGQFPGAALLFRRGDLQRGKPVLDETRLESDVWAAKPPALVEDPGYDPNRDPGEWSPAAGASRIPTLAYLVGPVQVRYTTDPAAARVEAADLSPWLDPHAGTVRANTNQIALDYHRGFLRVDSPRAQGLTGFFDAIGHRAATSDLSVEIDNPYAEVLAVSLDDAPLADSRRVLVQIGTIIRPTGWQTRPAKLELHHPATTIDGEEVVALGGPPWRVEKAAGSVTLRNAHVDRATVCDPNGLPVRDLPATRRGDSLTFPLPPDALYVVLRASRDAPAATQP